MKRFLTLICLGLMTVACSSDMTENRETRSTIYKGQSTWDMYENFGAPTHAVRLSPEEIHFIYRREEITRDWARMYFDWCDMVVATVDGYVTDWEVSGNQCFLNVADPDETIYDEVERENLVWRYQQINSDEEMLLPDDEIALSEEAFADEYGDGLFD